MADLSEKKQPILTTTAVDSIAGSAREARDDRHHLLSKRTLELHCRQRNHLDVRQGGQTLYHLAVHELGGDQPDLVLHRGTDSRGQRLAISKISRSSENIPIHLGPEKTPGKDNWDLVRCIISPSKRPESGRQYHFKVLQAGSPQKAFHWTKTREKELGASMWTGRDFKLVDEENEGVVAVYVDRMGLHAVGRRGRIEWLRECDESLEVQALIVLFSVLERKSRALRSVFKALNSGSGNAGIGFAM